MFYLNIRESFDAAHNISGYKGNCANIHGHRWVVEVEVKCPILNDIGISIDFKDLKTKLRERLKGLDHTNLNETEFFKDRNPTAENISVFIFTALREHIKVLGGILNKVRVYESPDSWVVYDGEE